MKATDQDMLLDLQRDAIDTLHKRIRCLEYDKHLIATTLHAIYYSILSAVQVWYKDVICKQSTSTIIKTIEGPHVHFQ